MCSSPGLLDPSAPAPIPRAPRRRRCREPARVALEKKTDGRKDPDEINDEDADEGAAREGTDGGSAAAGEDGEADEGCSGGVGLCCSRHQPFAPCSSSWGDGSGSPRRSSGTRKTVEKAEPVVRAPSRPMSERKEMKRLVLRGKDKGFVTFDEINESMPPDVTTLLLLEDTIALLAENEVEVVDDVSKMGDAQAAPVKGQLVESTETQEGPSTTPRCRAATIRCACTCARWASVSLLTREGEVEIAKRIEDGERRSSSAVVLEFTPICRRKRSSISATSLRKGSAFAFARSFGMAMRSPAKTLTRPSTFERVCKIIERAIKIVGTFQRDGEGCARRSWGEELSDPRLIREAQTTTAVRRRQKGETLDRYRPARSA